MPSTKMLQILNWLGFLFMITMNVLANALPLFGLNTGDISALYPNLFVPAGFTFSIWGVIYLLLLVFTIAQSRGLFGGGTAPSYVALIGPWYFISSLANGLWIVVWHALQPLLSLLVMLALLGALLNIYQRLRGLPGREGRYAARLPFSVYLGWISVATIANATAVLVHYGWGGFGLSPEIWTMVMVAIAIAAGLAFLLRGTDVPYALVIIWALYGIWSRTGVEQAGIYYLLLAGMIALAAVSLLQVRKAL